MTQASTPAMGHALEMGAAFHQSFGKALEYNRSLIEDTTGFAVSESRNFINLRLERAQQAMAQLENCNVSELAGVQQAWVRDLLQDYADQSVRYAQAIQGAARKSVQAAIAIQQPLAQKAQGAAQDMAHDAQHAGEDMAHTAENAMHNGNGHDHGEHTPQWNG